MTKKEFSKDRTYANLYEAVSHKKYPLIEKEASALKRMSEGLGYVKLGELSGMIATSVKIHCYKSIPKTFRQLEEEYWKIIRETDED